jgi:hypothetical protein
MAPLLVSPASLVRAIGLAINNAAAGTKRLAALTVFQAAIGNSYRVEARRNGTLVLALTFAGSLPIVGAQILLPTFGFTVNTLATADLDTGAWTLRVSKSDDSVWCEGALSRAGGTPFILSDSLVSTGGIAIPSPLALYMDPSIDPPTPVTTSAIYTMDDLVADMNQQSDHTQAQLFGQFDNQGTLYYPNPRSVQADGMALPDLLVPYFWQQPTTDNQATQAYMANADFRMYGWYSDTSDWEVVQAAAPLNIGTIDSIPIVTNLSAIAPFVAVPGVAGAISCPIAPNNTANELVALHGVVDGWTIPNPLNGLNDLAVAHVDGQLGMDYYKTGAGRVTTLGNMRWKTMTQTRQAFTFTSMTAHYQNTAYAYPCNTANNSHSEPLGARSEAWIRAHPPPGVS